MDNGVQLPEWTEDFRAGDDVFAAAWEEVGAQDRALLKTAIAFQFHLWGVRDSLETGERSAPREGFRTVVHSIPAPWTLALRARGYASPARLLAARLPAVLAGTRPAVVCLSDPPDGIAAALELAGIDDLFVMHETNARRLLGDLCAASAEGRLALFPWIGDSREQADPAQPFFSGAERERWLGVRTWRDIPRPSLILRPCASESEGRELERRLRLMHPDAVLTGAEADGSADAVFNAQDPRPADDPACLRLNAGMEACWTGPSPGFFRIRRCDAFLTPEVEDHG